MTEHKLEIPKPEVRLAVHAATRFVLVRPHYPENLGAAARAIKTMGFTELDLVRPSRLALPSHPMAFKMAVKAWDVLDAARLFETCAEAVAGVGLVLATTARRGFSGALEPRQAATEVLAAVDAGLRVSILFGNEKTGLSEEEHALARLHLRIPMAADQPSLNLAQATQLVAYELFMAGLLARRAQA